MPAPVGMLDLLCMIARDQERERMMLQAQVRPFYSANPEGGPWGPERLQRVLRVPVLQHGVHPAPSPTSTIIE